MGFVTGLPISTNLKRNNYYFILVIVDWLIKIVYYKSVKIAINIPRLAKVIIEIVVYHHGLPDLIMTNKELLFTLKLCSLYYFCYINWQLFIAFYS